MWFLNCIVAILLIVIYNFIFSVYLIRYVIDNKILITNSYWWNSKV